MSRDFNDNKTRYRVLEYIRQYNQRYNLMPTHKEIAKGVNIHPSGVILHLGNLRREGLIRIKHRQPRGIELI